MKTIHLESREVTMEDLQWEALRLQASIITFLNSSIESHKIYFKFVVRV